MSYTFRPAVKEALPLFIGLVGPTWSGKTFSALRLATGIVKVRGGQVVGIDTEARRMLQYADDFKFQYLEFKEPFSSLAYAEAMKAAATEAKGGCVIVDSMSHEHEGSGGYLEFHAQEVGRLIRDGGFKNEYSANIPAWNRPSQDRRQLVNALLQLNCTFIFCFRAKEKIKPVKGSSPRELGWQAIAGDEFGSEMSARCLLTPGCKGVPDWSEEAQKLGVPKRIKDHEAILKDGLQLSEDCGFALAQWAAGSKNGAEAQPASSSAGDPSVEGARQPSSALTDSDSHEADWKAKLQECTTAQDLRDMYNKQIHKDPLLTGEARRRLFKYGGELIAQLERDHGKALSDQ